MITFEEAKNIVIETAIATGTERVPLKESLNRILADNAVSDIDMPPFNKSAMDGYACRKEDLQNELDVLETIPAGKCPELSVGVNECSKIMTGAMVPEGTDCVIMVEYTEETDHKKIRFTGKETKENICYKAEDIKTGDIVLRKGVLIKPEQIAVLATLGYSEVTVALRPSVGIIATGSELVEPSEKVSGAMIRNSNGWQLAAQAERMGCEVRNYGIAIDTEEVIDSVIKRAMTENNVIILSGGVSMGDFDLVPGILKANGFETKFNKVAIQPGNPSNFAISRDIRCFGLPGNPVSTFVQFELLIKPFLYKMMGCDFKHITVQAELAEEVKRRKATRASITPVKFISPGKVIKVNYHGSAHISAMCNADGAIIIPVGETKMDKGKHVDVRLF